MKNLEFQNIALAQKLFGTHNVNLEKITRAFDVKINSRGGMISVSGAALYDMLDFEKVRAYIDAYEKSK